MKKAQIFLLFLILPLILFISATALKEVQGPYYMFFYDPSYVYLISSLNLAQFSGYGVAHFDHPGTTVQMIGALTVKALNLITGTGSGLVKDVLSQPEAYLGIMNRTFILINCAALLFLGFFIYRISDSPLLGLLVQLTPFSSAEIFYGLIIVTPENFLIFAGILYVGALWFYLLRDDESAGTNRKFAVAMSLICALGLATKISFFPLLVFPLLAVRGIKWKMAFMFLTILLFFVFVYPGLSNIEYFGKWITELALKSGKYGKGEATVINSAAFRENFVKIFTTDPVYALSFVSVLTALIAGRRKDKTHSPRYKRERLVLISLLLIFLVQSLIVAKHYSQYYMIPSFMLSVTGFLVSALHICGSSEQQRLSKKQLRIAGLTGLLIFLWSCNMIVSSYFEGNSQRIDAESMIDKIDALKKDRLFISSFGSSGSSTALAFASQYGAGQSDTYRAILSSSLPDNIFYNQWTDEFYSLNGQEYLRSELASGKPILLQISHYGNLEKFLASLERVSGEKVVRSEHIMSNAKKESLYLIYTN
ncbi:MAG: hypothetical protein K1X85_14860 [Ignavibacteria bacterium]|nr:hypothetical protein [Ignavibacteria bacterium]